MARVFIIGAGFSKSIADLPVTSKIMDKFKQVLQALIEKRNRYDRNRIIWGKTILDFWDSLQRQFFEIPIRQVGDDGEIIESNYWNNFEAVLSFIDLNCMNDVQGRLLAKNGETVSIGGKPMFYNGNYDLGGIRSFIETYLYLSLIDGKPNETRLKIFSNKMLSKGDVIITFNYDVILERFLFNIKRWFPRDGYGLDFNDFPEINPDFDLPSEITILKLHGSLNWKSDWLSPFELTWITDQNEILFLNYLKNFSQMPFDYRGGYSSVINWVLPSWFKGLDGPQLLHVWKKAANALRSADEITVIGYSLPKQDIAAVSLLGTIEYTCKKFKLIDPCANSNVERFRRITQFKNIQPIQQKFEDYLVTL